MRARPEWRFVCTAGAAQPASVLLLADSRSHNPAVLGLCGSFGLENHRTVELEQKIARLYNDFREPLFRYVLWLGVPIEEGEELIQETFFRLYKHLHRGGNQENLKSWLYKVTHNLALNTRRSRRRFKDQFEDVDPEQWRRLIDTALDPVPSPEAILLAEERLRRVHVAIGSLSTLQRSCVRLRIAGFRYREVAAILGVTIPTVSECLRRAMEKLTRSVQ